MTNFIKSPLNYTGNKYRILDQILPFFPKNAKIMVDLFCGGATVGLNCNYEKIYFIDNDIRVIGLLKFLSKVKFENLLNNLEELIKKYKLSNSYRLGYKFYKQQIKDKNYNNGLKEFNNSGFYKLRRDYNNLKNKDTNEANEMLYLLLLYGFNNDIRFNSKGEYNLPVGKTDLNKNNVSKLQKYIARVSNVNAEFLCCEFFDKKAKKIIDTADFIYMDPPYLITNAVYNENNGWNNQLEYKLLDLMDYFILENKQFMLSNVISKIGRTNEPLNYWVRKNKTKINIHNINYHYRGASYNKINRDAKEKEIIITLKKK